MDIDQAKEIIQVLADGIDPFTGEVLPKEHLCNQGDVVRAFYVALKTMSNIKSSKKKSTPENAGKPWAEDDDELLGNMFNNNMTKKEICAHFKRSEGGIASRLVRLGLISERDIFRQR